jgi:hypothetical protein
VRRTIDVAGDTPPDRPVASVAMSVRTLLVSSVVLATITFAARDACPENPNQAFNGRIIMSTKRFPAHAASPTAYTAAIRKQSQSNFYEDKANHNWKIYFAGFLKTKLDDVEYVIKLYELTGKSQQLLVSFDQFTDERGQQTILSNMTLDKKQIGVNKELLMTMENKGRILASGRFKILGEGEHYSGKVDFSEGDTKKNDDD